MFRFTNQQSSTDLGRYQQKIDIEKILIAHRNCPATLIGNALGAIPMTLVMQNTAYSLSAIGWFSVLYLLIMVRWWHYQSLDTTHADTETIFHYGKIQVLLACLSGCIWGSAGILFFDAAQISNIAFVILTLVCMLAGSLASLSARPIAYAAFSLPTMLPLSLIMLFQDERFYNWMGFGAIVYLAATFAFCLNLYKVIIQSLKLQYENLDLIKDLQEQKEVADKANRDKSRFLASASHDLRQPLHAVNLFTELLSQKLTSPSQQQDIGNIQQGLQSLNELLDVLLDMSRLDADIVHANKVSFDISSLLEKIEPPFQHDASRYQLSLNIDKTPYTVFSDPLLLERVITNLLVNAIRYTKQGGVELFFSEKDKTHIQLHIADTGIGIPKASLNDIFDEFVQLHNPERNRQKGLGLGLAIVRRIMNLLEHPIQINSQVNKGTEVILCLPLSDEQDNAEGSTIPKLSSRQNKLENLNVMIVDNELSIVEAMTALLNSWGCDCRAFTSTAMAIEAIKDGEKPDFMLVDYRMPGDYNGCAFVSYIESIIGKTSAIIITGDTSETVINEIKHHGFLRLQKPIKPVQLRLLMEKVLQR
jgi:two-component system, sensor histidine kinase